MPLEVRFKLDGSLREFWYGHYKAGGKRYCSNLGVRIAGTPPDPFSLRSEGDALFERSRAQAQAKLDAMIDEARHSRNSERLVERLYELKTGERIQSVVLDDLPEAWANIPRKRRPTERYAKQCKSTLKRFAVFVKDQSPKAVEMAHVTRPLARAFMDAEHARGVTAKTWSDTLKLMRATFKYLLPAGAANPFTGMPTRESDMIFRKPFTPKELSAILEAAQGDDFIRPILVTAICTAMRRGDCCLLKWEDVDLRKRFLNVKTNKTGQVVSIPIFPLLYAELKGRMPSEAYVFPEQAAMCNHNPDGITWRVRKVLAAAGFRDAKEGEKKGAVRGQIHAERKSGLRRASIRDFHSFRVTWVTLALTAGIPLELVQKVTGHKTAEIVLKHYFQPGREDFRQSLQSALPKLLTNGGKAPEESAVDIVRSMSAKTLERDKKRLLALLE
jgi:integrase